MGTHHKGCFGLLAALTGEDALSLQGSTERKRLVGVDGLAQLLAVEEVQVQGLHDGQHGHIKRASTKVEDENVLLTSGTLLVVTVRIGSGGRLVGLKDLHSPLPLKKSESRVCTMGCTMVSRDTSNVPRTRVEDENVLPTSGHFLSAPYAKVGSFIKRLQLRPAMAAAY